MNESNLILYLPFDESAGSNTASDYSKSRQKAILTDCTFTDGQSGKAISFDGEGHADITGMSFPLTGDFTLMASIKNGNEDDSIGLYLKYGNGADAYMQRWYSVPVGAWSSLVVVKNGLQMKVYIGEALMDTIELPANLVGFCINQKNYTTDYGYGMVDELRVYNVAATLEEIKQTASQVSSFKYYIDGKPLVETWGIYIESSDGLLDRPKLKTPFKQSWDDYHGDVVDLKDKRVESREITLKCWMAANGYMHFTQKWNDFISIFEKDGTVRLMLQFHPTHPLVYEVYLEDSLPVSKRWNKELMVGTFTLKLKEPDPVKRVLRVRVDNVSSTPHVSIKCKSDRMLTIAWGDGTFTDNVYGDHTTDSNKITHNYGATGIYYVIVSGVIEEVSDFDTDAIVIWNKI